MRNRPLLALSALGLVALLLVACNGNGDGPTGTESPRDVLTPVQAKYLPIVVSSDLAVGPNRFLLGLLNQEENDSQVLGADLHLRFFYLEGGEETLKSETDARAVRITRSFTHTHEDGTVEVHEAGETGIYVAHVEFDAPGRWGVEVTGTANGEEMEPVRPLFSVNETSATVNLGDPAPRSVQPTLRDVLDISEIDTSFPPVPEMHDMTIAEAVTSGKPTIVIFATPAFCQSQICGPMKDVVDELFRTYQGQAHFVHVEPYDVPRLREGDCPSLYECRSPVVDEWGLRTEPWVFLVDAQGNVAARYEAMVTYEELEDAIRELLG